MKKLFCLSLIAFSFGIQASSFASKQQTDLTMDQEDFAQLVCAYLESMPKEQALSELKIMTESILSTSQQETMESLAVSNSAVASLCGSI